MPHPVLDNLTPFASDLLLLVDDEGRPLLVPLLQATFSVTSDHGLVPLEPAPAIALGGEWWGDPASSSLKLEPQIAPRKPGTDVVLLGHAIAPGPGAVESRVGLRVGPLRKVLRIVGDRYLLRSGRITEPVPFERIPLRWERAFGGRDLRDPDPARHASEPRNPVGRGFRDPALPIDEDLPLPNIESPDGPFRGLGDRPAPGGFGFVAPDWMPRRAWAGTYDDAWMADRRPRPPLDFDARFHCAASEGLSSPEPMRGDEPVTIAGAVPEGRLDFVLPALPPPECTLAIRGGRRVQPSMTLDTIVIDADARTVSMTWRGAHPVRNGPQDLDAMQVRVPGLTLRNARFRA